jgi:hypothetical protein
MGFGVGFRSPFEARSNADDRRRAESAKTPQEAQALEHEAGIEHAQGRGSLGELIGAGKSIGDAIGASMGGISAVSGGGAGLADAYKDSGVHAGKDPVSG